MQIPKSQIVAFLESRGRADLAQQAAEPLPDQVDPQQYAETLHRFGVDLPALLSRLPGPLRAVLEG